MPFSPNVRGALNWARTQDDTLELHEAWMSLAHQYAEERLPWGPKSGYVLYLAWATNIAMLSAGVPFDLHEFLDDHYRLEDGTRGSEEETQDASENGRQAAHETEVGGKVRTDHHERGVRNDADGMPGQ